MIWNCSESLQDQISKGNPIAEHKPKTSRREESTISLAPSKDSRTGVTNGDYSEPGAMSSIKGIFIAVKVSKALPRFHL